MWSHQCLCSGFSKHLVGPHYSHNLQRTYILFAPTKVMPKANYAQCAHSCDYGCWLAVFYWANFSFPICTMVRCNRKGDLKETETRKLAVSSDERNWFWWLPKLRLEMLQAKHSDLTMFMNPGLLSKPARSTPPSPAVWENRDRFT